MAFQTLSNSNTFSQWITETQRSVAVLNQITDGGNTFTYFSNTNVVAGNDLTVGGDLTVRGFIILDDVGYNDLNVTGNADVAGTIDSNGAIFTNLNILNNTLSLNTTTLNVGTEATLDTLSVFDTLISPNIEINGDITGTSNLFVSNLVITQNVESLNVSSELFVGSDVTVYGNILAFLCCQNQLTLTGDLTANLVVINTASINTLIGEANTNIFNNIFTSNAFTSVQNTLAEFASLSLILG